MNNELIPGKDDEKFQKKMSNIDQWLDQISHVKGSPAQPKKTQPSKKTHPVQKTGQKNSRPAPSPQPMQKNSRPTPGPRPEQSSRPVQNPRP
ncbi:hypothetical protein HN680_07485, partial [Candidatus Peregrinibacteria bacterium]|nr:hypothetical protein [Candidatus Peregrinibacteria bacterium]